MNALAADPFGSPEAFREAFAAGLKRLLEDEEGLGPFILVLANAAFDPAVNELVRPELARRFGELARLCRRAIAAGREPEEPVADLSVFLELMVIGFDRIEIGRWRRLGPWEVQYNQVRSLRPKRSAGHRPEGIRVAFDPKGFHFNRSFLRKETFWRGRLAGAEVDLLYNKFPFVELHALLVPEREANGPQYLSDAWHGYAWDLVEQLASTLPGIGLAYNSYGAFASVNHLHFQMFVRDRPLPVVLPQWRHNGGPVPYPACCECYSSGAEARDRIADLQGQGIAFNALYLPGRVYCFPRRMQGAYLLPPWCGGQAWYEMSGGVVAFNADDFASLRDEDVRSALALAAEGLCG